MSTTRPTSTASSPPQRHRSSATRCSSPTWSGERTDFIRLNNGDVRQAGSVDQRTLTVDLIEGRRHTGGSIRLSGVRSIDDARLTALLVQLRDQRRLVSDDPFLLYNTEPNSTERVERGSIPEPDAALADIRAASSGRDLVGIYASGDMFEGFANSLGQRNWFQSSTFNLDWSFYLHHDKAAKNIYAGFDWNDDAFAAKVDWSARQLAALERDPISLSPGDYRTYLAPAGDGGTPPTPLVLRRVRAPGPRDPTDASAEDARRRCPPLTARLDQRGHRQWRCARTSSRQDSSDRIRYR